MNWKERAKFGGAGFVIGAALVAWSATLFQNPISASVMSSTASMIVQISSFVAAGYIAGIFFYLAELSKGFRDLRRTVFVWAFASEKTLGLFHFEEEGG